MNNKKINIILVSLILLFLCISSVNAENNSSVSIETENSDTIDKEVNVIFDEHIPEYTIDNTNNTYEEIYENDLNEYNFVPVDSNDNIQIPIKNNTLLNMVISEPDNKSNSILSTSYELQAYNLITYYHSSDKFNATLYYNGYPVGAGYTIIISLNSISYTKTTNSQGTVELAINSLNAGTLYEVLVYYPDSNGNGIHINAYILVKYTIISKDLTKYYKNSSQYKATFYDSHGNLLKNTVVSFNINGNIYTRTTDSNGIAQMNINLQPGTYTITAINPSSTENRASTITVLPVLEASDLTMNYGDGSKFNVKVLNGQGGAYSGQTVQFNINGYIQSVVSNSNGIASWDLSFLSRGVYTVTTSYNGMSISNTIKVL